MKTEVLKVEGMSCGHCVKTIENALKVAGVEAKAELNEKKVTVTYDENKIGLDSISNVIEDNGYTVS